ncbi:cupin domain-containing protein [Nisaea acidiphila]|uniref:Cupin domain-containing protein n=1 Tax=Nisaea acidiphila TaxID=1862145 RepID=A0A9J7ALC6_9PROT|nr:cupin domain-containing protein [Nisaea acidiphila]UUX48280.1 cupin domain-containing protein [Nisaea acidiphila]
MEINADFSSFVATDSNLLPWVPSPMAGVDRRMLDRIGDEVARATTIVRYAAGSKFSAHTHGGGEEFLVLDGTFSDEHGDYGPGMYVRNPVGSSHSPFTRAGCTIFVKLWQMREDDQEFVRIDTRAQDARWEEGAAEGISVLPLFDAEDEHVYLTRYGAGAAQPPFEMPGGGEFLVLEGAVESDGVRHETGSWLRFPKGARATFTAPEMALVWTKTGHLAGL